MAQNPQYRGSLLGNPRLAPGPPFNHARQYGGAYQSGGVPRQRVGGEHGSHSAANQNKPQLVQVVEQLMERQGKRSTSDPLMGVSEKPHTSSALT